MESTLIATAPIARLIKDVFAVAFDFVADGAFTVGLAMLVKIGHHQGQQALRGLLQRTVQHLVDLVPDQTGGDADRCQPEQAEAEGEQCD